MRKPLLILTLISIKLYALSQEEGRMETDRPDQTESPYLTKKKYIQVEVGFNYEKNGDLHSLVHPTILWKYGACKRFEFRLITEFVSAETPLLTPNGNQIETGLLPIKIGGKISLWEEKGLLPKTSFIFHIAPSNIGLGYNLGLEFDGESGSPSWVYTIAPGFNIGKNWYSYIEMFGAVKKNEEPHHAVDGGLAYFFSDNTKIDISSGFSLSDDYWYSAIGFSFRFNTSKKK